MFLPLPDRREQAALDIWLMASLWAGLALAAGGFLAAFEWHLGSLPYLSRLFALAGISIAFVDALEGAFTADLVEENLRGAAYGVLGTVNGFGDLVASLPVWTLWTSVSPVMAFGYAACLMAVGAVVIAGRPGLKPRSDDPFTRAS